jgi:uncharacterized protein
MVTGMSDSPARERLQLALREAQRSRDTIAASALRSALAAIDNAGAIPAGPGPAPAHGGPHVAGSAPGLGAGEAERRRLSENDIDQIVRAEVAERQAAARDYDRAGHAGQADRLRGEARILMAVIEAGQDPQASRDAG